MSSPVRIWTEEEKAGLLAAFTYDAQSGKFFHKVDKNHGRHVPVRAGDEAHGSRDSNGYIVLGCNGRIYTAHRLAWFFNHGEFPELHIDHIDHNRTNNSISNLRMVQRDENHRNKTLNKRNSSGKSDVWHDRNRNNWMVRICLRGKRVTVGRFKEKQDAVNARWIAETLAGFHSNHGAANTSSGVNHA